MSTLTIVFNGDDNVRPIVANISQEMNTLNQSFSTAKEGGTSFFGGLLQTVGGFLAANVIGGITSQVTGFFSSAISDARESNQIFAQTEAAIKSTGGAAGVTAQQVADMASSMSAAEGKSLFDDDDIEKGDNLLLTFTNIRDTLPDAQSAMVDMATAMHTDVSAGAIQLGKALNDPEKGITALTRVGVTFTEEQKNQIKALQETGDMAGAQRIILAELNKEFGGSAAAAAKADGGMAQFKAQMGDVGKEIGNALLPAIGQLVGIATSRLMPVIQEAAHWLAEKLPGAIDAVGAALAPIGAVVDTVSSAWVSAGDATSSFTEQLGFTIDTLIGVADDVQGPFQTAALLVQSLMSGDGAASDELASKVNDLKQIWIELQPAVSNTVSAIGALVTAIFGQVQAFIDAHGADIAATMEDTWNRIMVIIKLGIQLYNAIVPPVLTAIAKFINEHGAQIQQILSNTWNAIKAAIDIVLTAIEGVIRIALDLIHGNWSQAWSDLQTMSARIVQDLWQIIKGGLDNIAALFGTTLNTVASNFTHFVTVTVPSFGKGIIDGIINGVADGVGALENAIENAAQSALDAAKRALGISSPSRVFADEVGAQISAGIAHGITHGQDGINRALGGIASPRLALAGAGGGATMTNSNSSSSIVNIGAVNTYAARGQSAQQITTTTLREINRRTGLRRS